MKYTKPIVNEVAMTGIQPRGECSGTFSCGNILHSHTCDDSHTCEGKKFSCNNYN